VKQEEGKRKVFTVTAGQTLATGAAEAEQTDGKAGKMTNTRS